ncbi:GDP-L-fucose synthase [candidate division KSB1 bacterium]|nr:GDP-L-fucose synthase [candidate division KSB1 bacterium]
MSKTSKIYIPGDTGMVGSALVRCLKKQGYENLLLKPYPELDLLNQAATARFFETEKPEYVFLAAAKVGGILANDTYRGQFIYENLQIELNVIHAAYLNGVKKLLFLGSSCIYPRLAPQPIKEEYLLTGLLEPTNEPYAIAKIAGIKMCQTYNDQYGTHYISVMPTNLYGPNDNFDLETAHALPALIRRIHEAKMANEPFVQIWGTGAPKREFLHVDDLADACVYLMNHYDGSNIINIGVGEDLSIKELALLIKKIVGYDGEMRFDTSKPDGTPRKLLDVSRLHALGWGAKIGLEEGIRRTYEWYQSR